ncbi:transposase [Paenibacillus sp. YYML68]
MIYRCRWQIEIFFRWVKRNLKLTRFQIIQTKCCVNFYATLLIGINPE